MSYTLEQGTRTSWTPRPTTDVRALESPAQTERRATDLVRRRPRSGCRLNFTAPTAAPSTCTPSTGMPRRAENVTVDDGSGPRTVALTTAFNPGAWIHFPITVAAGGRC